MGISKIFLIVSSIMIFLLSSLGLYGWVINNVNAKIVVPPGTYSLSPYSSFFLFLFAIFLLWQAFGPSKLYQVLRMILFMAMHLFSLSIVVNYLFGLDFHLDQLFFTSKLEGGSRMLFSSAICFQLFSSIFLLINNRIKSIRVLLQGELFIILVIVAQGIIFPIFDLSGLFSTKFAIPISLPVAFSFVFLAIGIITIRDDFEVNIFFRSLVMKSSINKKANIALLLGLSVLLLVGIISYINVIKLNESSKAVSNKLEVIRLRYRLVLDLVNAETAQRGYLITSDRSYLFPYSQGITDYPSTYKALLNLAKTPDEVKNLHKINSLAQKELDGLTLAIKLRNSKGIDPALQAFTTNENKNYMGQIKEIVARMDYTDQKTYVHLVQANSEASDRILNIILSGSVLGLTIVILAIILLNKRFDTRLKF